MKIFKLKRSAYRYYKENVRGNENITFEEAQRKLSRNIELAIKFNLSKNRDVYLYGNLHIHTKGNKIIKLQNHWENNEWFYSNNRRKQELNKMYNIVSTKQDNEIGSMDYINEYSKGFKN